MRFLQDATERFSSTASARAAALHAPCRINAVRASGLCFRQVIQSLMHFRYMRTAEKRTGNDRSDTGLRQGL